MPGTYHFEDAINGETTMKQRGCYVKTKTGNITLLYITSTYHSVCVMTIHVDIDVGPFKLL